MKLLLISVILIVFNIISLTAQTVEPDCPQAAAKIARYEAQLKDWANLNRYREANGKLQPLSKDESRVVFMGDSITDGWNLTQYFPGKPYINRGIGGQTTPQMLLRFRRDVIDLKPKLVVILAGTNDIAGNTGAMTLEETTHNIASMAEIAKANSIKVIISSVLPVSDRVKNKEGVLLMQTNSRPNSKITALNDLLKKYAADNKIVYLDYYKATTDGKGTLMDGLSYDGLHPNADGYRIMQSMAEAAITRALKR